MKYTVNPARISELSNSANVEAKEGKVKLESIIMLSELSKVSDVEMIDVKSAYQDIQVKDVVKREELFPNENNSESEQNLTTTDSYNGTVQDSVAMKFRSAQVTVLPTGCTR